MDLGLTGRRVLVGGASRGLGAAIATALAAEGAHVALAARASSDLTATTQRIGGLEIPADLSERDGPAQAVERAVVALGGLDGLVVNSGGPPGGAFSSVDEDAWQ